MHRILNRASHPKDGQGSAIFLAPLLVLMMVYLTGFFVDLGDGFAKADGLDQALSLSAAAASTQVSASEFYRDGLVVLDPDSSQKSALSRLITSIPKGAVLEIPPSVTVAGGAVCVRATEQIKMPFSLIPGLSPYLSYSSSSSAIAKGSATNIAPKC